MSKIKNVVFDLGGVIISLDTQQPIDRFKAMGVKDIEEFLNPYLQKGIFLEVETGALDAEGFRRKLSEHIGKELTAEQVKYGWLGFVVDVPQYKLDYIEELRKNYNVYLLSNTNPIIQSWARSTEFSPAGKPISDYFDKMYASYEVGYVKPDRRIYEYMIKDSGMNPEETLFVDDGKHNIDIGNELGFVTYQPENKEDWRETMDQILVNS